MSENNENQVSKGEGSGGNFEGIKTAVSWIVVVAVVVLGFYFYVNGNDATTETTTDDQKMEDGVLTDEEAEALENIAINNKENIVTYTDDGFSPKEITISKGESVTFKNESSGGMWIGSALHPTHKNYPIKTEDDCLGSAFDQCDESSNGTTWTFQFDAEGEHGYHNHVKANDWGKVIVK